MENPVKGERMRTSTFLKKVDELVDETVVELERQFRRERKAKET